MFTAPENLATSYADIIEKFKANQIKDTGTVLETLIKLLQDLTPEKMVQLQIDVVKLLAIFNWLRKNEHDPEKAQLIFDNKETFKQYIKYLPKSFKSVLFENADFSLISQSGRDAYDILCDSEAMAFYNALAKKFTFDPINLGIVIRHNQKRLGLLVFSWKFKDQMADFIEALKKSEIDFMQGVNITIPFHENNIARLEILAKYLDINFVKQVESEGKKNELDPVATTFQMDFSQETWLNPQTYTPMHRRKTASNCFFPPQTAVKRQRSLTIT